MRVRRSATFGFALLLFFFSGFSALLYQVIWQRMLGLFSGTDVYSVTVIVAAFMAGLGCGSLAGGYLADRLRMGSRLLLFCAAELIIALFALLSKALYYDLLYVRYSGLAENPAVLATVLFASLLLPTFLMGVTLPVLSRSFVDRIERAPAVVGYLYGTNTLGAAAGAFCTGWILLRHFSFEEILRLSAGLNGLTAVGAACLWWALAAHNVVETPAKPRPSDETAGVNFPPAVWMTLYGLSGFVALSLEIVWFRLLSVLQKSTSFTFANLLGLYLFGLALGALSGVPIARRIRRPAFAFFILQATVVLCATVGLAGFVGLIDRAAFLSTVWVYVGGYEPLSPIAFSGALTDWFQGRALSEQARANLQLLAQLYFLIPSALILPATVLMGASFPVLQKVVQTAPALLGRRVGWLQAANILGSMAGAIFVGWFALRAFGTANTLRLLLASGAAFLGFAILGSGARRGAKAFATIVAVAACFAIGFALPSPPTLWSKLHGAQPGTILYAENESGLSVLKAPRGDFKNDPVSVFTNGIGQSWIPYGSVHTQLGLFAAMLHPNPEQIAVIGLGSGDTVFALGGSPRTIELTCIEIVESEYETLQQLVRLLPYPALVSLLQDSRIKWRFGDGRAFLGRSGKRYDVIEADALRPNSAYSGNLYSYEYFEMLAGHLRPGGIAVTWAPTRRILASFRRAFPHVLLIDQIAIGSEETIEFDPQAMARRFADPFTRDYYARLGIDLTALAGGYFEQLERGSDSNAAADLNSDMFPRDEYSVPERAGAAPPQENKR